jgi:DNA mismatch repair protein MutL
VNNRFMKHPYFHKAVIEAYQNILPPESVPSYFIFMDADPASIDINIHPSKTEIKFEDERSIWQILMASVREALGRFNIAPSLDFDNEVLVDIPVRNQPGGIPEPPGIPVNTRYNPFESEENQGDRSVYIDRFERESSSGWERLYSSLANNSAPGEKPAGMGDSLRKFFQIKNKYIICPVKSGLMLIDQKRAHERVLYERFMKYLSNEEGVSQVDMFPVKMVLNPADYLILSEIDDSLYKLGFRISHEGNNTISITGRPAETVYSDPAEMMEIILEDYKNTGADPASGAKEKVSAAIAAASAIPYGKVLTHNEMEELFDTLFACSGPNYSPGGKPVISIIPTEEIDKRFR